MVNPIDDVFIPAASNFTVPSPTPSPFINNSWGTVFNFAAAAAFLPFPPDIFMTGS